MPSAPDLHRQIQEEIESFLASLEHPVLSEEGKEVFHLAPGQWRLAVAFGKLLFEAWDSTRSLTRRIEGVAYWDRRRMGVLAKKPGASATSTLEFRERDASSLKRVGENSWDRTRFGQELLALLRRTFPRPSFDRVSNRSDREHSFSAWYTRGLARQGHIGWAFLGLHDEEPIAAADAVLAYGLIWLNWLRSQSERVVVTGLKLFLPPQAVSLTAHRAAYLNRHAAPVEIFAWTPNDTCLTPVDLRDFGNVATRLTSRHSREDSTTAMAERLHDVLEGLPGDVVSNLNLIPDPSGNALSLRILGLEVARVEGMHEPRVYFGLEGSYRQFDEGNRAEFRDFLKLATELRRACSQNPAHEFYCLQPERWLESLLVRDVTRIDPALQPKFVYPQVPAFTGAERGVVDSLSVTGGGRLAVIELKLHEEINLPMQGLDYWLRVKWLNERDQFQEFGYFPGLQLSKAPPLLYLVCPALRFHSTFDAMIRFLDPSVDVIQVGLNDRWREEVRVMFRRQLRAGVSAKDEA